MSFLVCSVPPRASARSRMPVSPWPSAEWRCAGRDTVVADAYLERCRRAPQVELEGLRVGVTERIGGRLLHDPVRGPVDLGRQAGRQCLEFGEPGRSGRPAERIRRRDGDVDVHARGVKDVEQRADIGEAAGCLALVASPRRSPEQSHTGAQFPYSVRGRRVYVDHRRTRRRLIMGSTASSAALECRDSAITVCPRASCRSRAMRTRSSAACRCASASFAASRRRMTSSRSATSRRRDRTLSPRAIAVARIATSAASSYPSSRRASYPAWIRYW